MNPTTTHTSTDRASAGAGVLIDPEGTIAAFYDAFKTSSDRRLTRIAEVFTEDVHFCDDIHDIVGYEALDRMAEWINANWPGCRFEGPTDVRHHHRQIRFDWALVDAEGECVTRGQDLLLVADDGRISHDFSFLSRAS